ncbi:hypothetical protein VPH35_075471 [Triticum aestivum]
MGRDEWCCRGWCSPPGLSVIPNLAATDSCLAGSPNRRDPFHLLVPVGTLSPPHTAELVADARAISDDRREVRADAPMWWGSVAAIWPGCYTRSAGCRVSREPLRRSRRRRLLVVCPAQQGLRREPGRVEAVVAVELVASVAVGEEAGTGGTGRTCSAVQVMWELEVAWARSAQADAWWSAPAGFIRDVVTGPSLMLEFFKFRNCWTAWPGCTRSAPSVSCPRPSAAGVILLLTSAPSQPP